MDTVTNNAIFQTTNKCMPQNRAESRGKTKIFIDYAKECETTF